MTPEFKRRVEDFLGPVNWEEGAVLVYVVATLLRKLEGVEDGFKEALEGPYPVPTPLLKAILKIRPEGERAYL